MPRYTTTLRGTDIVLHECNNLQCHIKIMMNCEKHLGSTKPIKVMDSQLEAEFSGCICRIKGKEVQIGSLERVEGEGKAYMSVDADGTVVESNHPLHPVGSNIENDEPHEVDDVVPQAIRDRMRSSGL